MHYGLFDVSVKHINSFSQGWGLNFKYFFPEGTPSLHNMLKENLGSIIHNLWYLAEPYSLYHSKSRQIPMHHCWRIFYTTYLSLLIPHTYTHTHTLRDLKCCIFYRAALHMWKQEFTSGKYQYYVHFTEGQMLTI